MNKRSRRKNEKKEESNHSAESGKDGHHHSSAKILPFPQLPSLITAVRQKEDDESHLALWRWCERFVKRWHCSGLSPETRLEIVQASLNEAFRTPELTDHQRAELLTRALEKYKKREQRALAKPEAELTELNAPTTPSHENSLLACEHLEKTLRWIFAAIAEELPKLKDRDFNRIVRYYELQRFFPPRDTDRTVAKPEAARKALYRARMRFREAIQRWLERRLARTAPTQSRPLEHALEIVQGERILEAIDGYLELKRGA
jgi:hypothetical protein